MNWIKNLIVAIALFSAAPLSAQLVVAHRGASHEAPENTIAAFNLAWERGADAIEGDFYLTADKRIACIHDKDTKRVAGVDVKVAESTLAELRKLDVGRWKDEKYAGERIATLEEVLDTVPKGKYFFIELKSGPEIVPPLKAILDAADIDHGQLRIICFDAAVIDACKKAMPRIKAYWLTSFRRHKETGEWSPTIDSVLATLRRIQCDGVDAQAEPAVVTEAFVKQVHDAGYECHLWTINEPEIALRFAAFDVDSITTDRPALLRRVLDEAKAVGEVGEADEAEESGAVGEVDQAKASGRAAARLQFVQRNLATGHAITPCITIPTGCVLP